MSLSQSKVLDNSSGVLGIVMCGGLSTRMGHDKGLLKRDDKYWAQIIAEKFKRLNVEYVFSISPEQEDKYKMTLGENEIFVVDNSIFEGPLNGLWSVHKKFPQKNLIPIACDMLHFNEEIIAKLAIKLLSHLNYAYFAVPISNSEKFEPFGALYSSRGLKTIRIKDAKTNLSLSQILRKGATLSIENDDLKSFTNYNAPGDLL